MILHILIAMIAGWNPGSPAAGHQLSARGKLRPQRSTRWPTAASDRDRTPPPRDACLPARASAPQRGGHTGDSRGPLLRWRLPPLMAREIQSELRFANRSGARGSPRRSKQLVVRWLRRMPLGVIDAIRVPWPTWGITSTRSPSGISCAVTIWSRPRNDGSRAYVGHSSSGHIGRCSPRLISSRSKSPPGTAS